MSTSSRSNFEQCALAAGLLTEQQLDDARAAPLRWAAGNKPAPEAALTDQQLAERLVDMGGLNRWQAKQLLEGRTKFTLGNYRIIDSLGKGGMGQVFKGEHQLTGRVVAIKVLPRDKCTPQAVANFSREIQAQAKLDHPKLVRALDDGYDGSVFFLVTEFVPGGDLRKLVRRHGPLSMEMAANIISQVAEGLQHAHEQGIVHRDVKPGNVLVTLSGEAKLSDLGLAGPLGKEDVENDPRYGKIVGTADYLAPDHIISPWNPTPAWDIYSLGCTLYYAVTAKVPFPGGSTADKARAHCELRPLDPRRLNPSLTTEFVDVMADMMAKDPEQRIRTAAEVQRQLAPWATRATAVPQFSMLFPSAPATAGLPIPPVVPPPIVQLRVVPPPVAIPSGPLPSDTVPDFLSGADTDSDSDGSLSLIVATNHRPPGRVLLWVGSSALGATALAILFWVLWCLLRQ